MSLLLKAGGNWNNALQAGPGYRNGNNSTSNSNRNNGAHVELRFVIKKNEPEQHTNQSFRMDFNSKAKDDAHQQESVGN